MAHIHTGPGEHDFTVSAFIVRTDFDEPKLVLHMHKKLGKWLQFGGHVELNEDPWQALGHELLEESGYDLSQLQLIQPFKGPELTNCVQHPVPITVNTHAFNDEQTHFHIDLAYAFTTDSEPANTLAAGESEDIQHFSVQELQEIPTGKIPENVRQTGIFILEKLI